MELNNIKTHNSFLTANYFIIWLAMLILTGVSITFAGIYHSNIIVIITMTIAFFQAFLSLRFFTKLNEEKRKFLFFSFLSLLILLIALLLLLPDTITF